MGSAPLLGHPKSLIGKCRSVTKPPGLGPPRTRHQAEIRLGSMRCVTRYRAYGLNRTVLRRFAQDLQG